MLDPRDPTAGTRELEGSREVDPRVAPLPKDGPVRPVGGRRTEPEPEVLGRVAEPTRERLRGANTLGGAERVAPTPGDAVRFLIVGGLAVGLRGAAAVGVPIRFAREPPTGATGLVLVPPSDPFRAALRDDRLRAPMPRVVLDWSLLAGVAGAAERGDVREVPRAVFNAPILERVLGTKTPGVVVRLGFARPVPALVAGATGRAVRTVADRARTPGFAVVAGTALVPLERWVRIAGETPVRFDDGVAGFPTALRVPAAADERAAGVAGRLEPPLGADRALVPDLARMAGFL